MADVELLVFQLEAGCKYESKLYKVPKGATVRFTLGPSLYGHTVSLFINSPSISTETFKRTKYRQLAWKHHFAEYADEGNCFADCLFETPGSFRFYFVLDGRNEENGSGYLLVDPVLTLAGCRLPPDAIQCQTVLSKCLGPFEHWEDKIAVAAASGYNMVHFTPVQALGGSNSAYSLKNHMALNEAFAPSSGGNPPTFDDLKAFVGAMESKYRLLALTDIVLNHTANETPWLREHPECAYNATNSPHLRPAMLLDQELYLLAMRAMRGETTAFGIPSRITDEAHVQAVRAQICNEILPRLKLHEFYQGNTELLVQQYTVAIAGSTSAKMSAAASEDGHLSFKQTYTRLGATCDIAAAVRSFGGDPVSFRRYVEEFNERERRHIEEHLRNAVENVVKGMRYHKVDSWGPKQHEITRENPLIVRYFLPNHDSLSDEISTEEMEASFEDGRGVYIMAHNGWVMGDDPLRNFAQEGSMVYLRREIIAWGDSCKLRYGDKVEDCPFLWKYMEDYVRKSAEIFHGLRLDNCHSTPIHVAEYLLDAARAVRQDLYVIAELFTSSEEIDNIFVNRLGINSLIREALQACDSHELGRLVHRYGGIPVGSFFHAKGVVPLMPSVAHAIFVDMTHDNPSPYEKRSVYDFLASAALVSMAACATGSSRGYDELVPHHIHVVHEDRVFAGLSELSSSKSDSCAPPDRGIMPAKRALNDLHFKLAMEGFVEVYVDQLDFDTVAVTRRCPHTDKSVVLVARTAFHSPVNPQHAPHLKSLHISGKIDKILLEAQTIRKEMLKTSFVKDPKIINGLEQYCVSLKVSFPACDSLLVGVNDVDSENCLINFVDLKPGSVVAFSVSVSTASSTHMEAARRLLQPFGYFKSKLNIPSNVKEVINNLDLDDLNRIMFRCDQEEKSDNFGVGSYALPVLGSMIYCGLQGVMSHLSFIRPRNDLGHPLCSNVRDGDWLMDYLINRLRPHRSCTAFAALLEQMFAPIRKVPHYLKPCYFDAVVTALFSQLLDAAWKKMSRFISCGSDFVRELSLASVILIGFVYDSPLPSLSAKLTPSVKLKMDAHTSLLMQQCPTIAAGLPHFSTGYMRNWGRDTFIALRGLLLLTGRFTEARLIILGFAGTLRHGLIPNLLDRGTNSRYNCRDAVWFWLECVKQYVDMVPGGEAILQDPVSRLYPTDESEAQKVDCVVMPLCEVMQEALERHWNGISFRERNAGSRIDAHMTDSGFNITAGIRHENGFVFGGNAHNCGTWMDKMGSVPGRNRGQPASPRDGSAIELVGLCKSVISWLHTAHVDGKYPYEGVSLNGTLVTFKEWATRIQDNFEAYFWIPANGCGPHDVRPDLINKRCIYKDTLGSELPWADYQFRPNFAVAMVVAPELFNVENARLALGMAERVLKGPLGMKTLDPSDMTYNGNYDNCDADAGFNYHRGPVCFFSTENAA